MNKNIPLSAFTFPMWKFGNTPKVGDWFYAPAESGLISYLVPARLDAIEKSTVYEYGITVCSFGGLGIDAHNLRSFLWYRPISKPLIIIK